MAVRFSPLAFPTALHDLPLNYAQRITLYDGEGNFSARQHMDRFDDFTDLEEVDYEDVKMRLFAQSLYGKPRNGLETSLLDPFLHSKMHSKKGRMIIRVHYKCCRNIRITRKGV